MTFSIPHTASVEYYCNNSFLFNQFQPRFHAIKVNLYKLHCKQESKSVQIDLAVIYIAIKFIHISVQFTYKSFVDVHTGSIYISDDPCRIR